MFIIRLSCKYSNTSSIYIYLYIDFYLATVIISIEMFSIQCQERKENTKRKHKINSGWICCVHGNTITIKVSPRLHSYYYNFLISTQNMVWQRNTKVVSFTSKWKFSLFCFFFIFFSINIYYFHYERNLKSLSLKEDKDVAERMS